MTKEELKQEAEENSKIVYGYINDAYVLGHIESAEPREKRITELEAKVRALEIEQHYCMPNCSKVTELETQIEKMKCCENCGWYYLQQHWRESKEINESRMFHCGTCGNKRNWKIKEIKEK